MDIIAHDVIRWRERVWKPKARKNSRAVAIGERFITAEVLRCDGDWIELALKSCETTNAETWWKRIPELKADKPLRRRRSTIEKGNPQRRPWGGADGEAARAISASKFLR